MSQKRRFLKDITTLLKNCSLRSSCWNQMNEQQMDLPSGSHVFYSMSYSVVAPLTPDPIFCRIAVIVVKHHHFKRNTISGFLGTTAGKPLMIEQEGLSLTRSYPNRVSRFPLQPPVTLENTTRASQVINHFSYRLLQQADSCCRKMPCSDVWIFNFFLNKTEMLICDHFRLPIGGLNFVKAVCGVK